MNTIVHTIHTEYYHNEITLHEAIKAMYEEGIIDDINDRKERQKAIALLLRPERS